MELQIWEVEQFKNSQGIMHVEVSGEPPIDLTGISVLLYLEISG